MGVARVFVRALMITLLGFLKTRLIPTSGEITREKQCPITCLNNMNKSFSSFLPDPIYSHLINKELMEN